MQLFETASNRKCQQIFGIFCFLSPFYMTKSDMILLIFYVIDDMIINVARAIRRVPMTEWQPPEPIALACQEYIGREVRDIEIKMPILSATQDRRCP